MRGRDKAELRRLWEAHRRARVPPAQNNEAWASLMLDESSIAGVVSSVLDPGQHLRTDQRVILERCLADLDGVLPQLDGASQAYAGELREMAVEALVSSGGLADPGWSTSRVDSRQHALGDVVERFFAGECNEYVRERLLGAIERRDQGYFAFNAFNVRLNFPTDEAVIQDELDAIEGTLSILAFEVRLRGSSS